jgi:antitoxin (DNA-binding transcriptional repressor) of toxin-antitoxin stability system
MIVTADELEANVAQYLDIAQGEDIIITRQGIQIARITADAEQRIATAKSLFGILPSTANENDIVEERMKRYAGNS